MSTRIANSVAAQTVSMIKDIQLDSQIIRYAVLLTITILDSGIFPVSKHLYICYRNSNSRYQK